MRWDLGSVARSVGGVAVGEAVITAVVTDSRRAGPGSLFVALRGERHDGHDFVADATGSGAAAVLVERGRLGDGATGIEVPDPMAALLAMARRRRAELTVPTVAVTGSTGKTTTKDLIAAVLGPGTHAAPASYNNEIGVPVTVLSCPDSATNLVIEVGSRGLGHITSLADAIRPDVAVITNIGPAHLEAFGDVATVRRAKWELVEALAPHGVAVLPAADAALVALRSGPLVTFGEGPGADVSADAVVMDDRGRCSFVLSSEGASAPVALRASGRHQVLNAAAAAAAGRALGVPLATAATRLESARLSPWRMEVAERPVAGGTVTVVNDAYNANPDSMEAALTTVAAMPGRHLAVLGKMHELGEASPLLHEAVGRRAAELGFGLIVVGDDPGIARGAGSAVLAVAADPGAAANMMASMLRPGDVVLVKASRATGLEALAAAIGGGAAA